MTETSINIVKCNCVKSDKIVYGEEVDIIINSRYMSAWNTLQITNQCIVLAIALKLNMG